MDPERPRVTSKGVPADDGVLTERLERTTDPGMVIGRGGLRPRYGLRGFEKIYETSVGYMTHQRQRLSASSSDDRASTQLPTPSLPVSFFQNGAWVFK